MPEEFPNASDRKVNDRSAWIDDLPSVIIELDASGGQATEAAVLCLPHPPSVITPTPLQPQVDISNSPEHASTIPSIRKRTVLFPSPFYDPDFVSPTDSYDHKMYLITVILIPYFWFMFSGPTEGNVSGGVAMLLIVGSIALGWYGYLGLAKLTKQRGEELAFRSMTVFLGTAGVGVMLLLLFQEVVLSLVNWNKPAGGLWGLLLFAIVKIVGTGYKTVFTTTDLPHPVLYFLSTFCSVALCEELLKLAPVLLLLRHSLKRKKTLPNGKIHSSQELLFLGAISGLGFGISEGIIYTADVYRPMQAGFELYFLRFFCVTILHGLWSYLSTAFILQKVSEKPLNIESKSCIGFAILGPMCLHSFYNTAVMYESYGLGLLGIVITITTVFVVAVRVRPSQANVALAPIVTQ